METGQPDTIGVNVGTQWRTARLEWRSSRRREQPKAWLHVLLAAGILLYLYSPLLDHLLHRESYSVPHIHVQVPESFLSQHTNLHGTDAVDGSSDHDQHDENVLCFLNIDALLSLLLQFTPPLQTLIGPQNLLLGGLDPVCLDVTLVYLQTFDPPPTF